MENKFKVGDRVRITADMERPYYMWVEKGDIGVIVEGESSKGFECVKIDGCANMDYVCVESNYLEADTTYDPKTAFLSDLAAVLRKHNANIWMDSYGFDADFLRIDLEGAEKQSFEVENGVINHDEEIKIQPLNPNWY